MHLVLTFTAGKTRSHNDSEGLKSSRGDEHNDDDDVIITSLQPWLLPSRPVS